MQKDQARAKALRSSASGGDANVASAAGSLPIENDIVTYVATVGVGSPATECRLFVSLHVAADMNIIIDSLLIDTGSSNTWVGAGKKFVKTGTSVQTKDHVVRHLTNFSLTALS